jgi:hypothetical protein
MPIIWGISIGQLRIFLFHTPRRCQSLISSGRRFHIHPVVLLFSYFADLFTNGTDDYSEIYGEIYDVSMGAGTLCLESMHLYPKTNPNAKVYGEKFVDNGYVDFLGYEITQIDLHFDDLDLYVQDGWTYTYWDVTIGIYGEPVPEPCSLSFLLLGTLAFYRRSKILSSK